MTRDEFIEDVNDWYDLRMFCDENGCYECTDILSKDEVDEHINNSLRDIVDNVGNWEELLERLLDFPTYDGFFVRDDYGGFRELDEDDFDSYKESVLGWADNEELFDEDNDQEYDESNDINLDMDSAEEDLERMLEENDPDRDYEIGNEEISLGELFSLKEGDVQWI